MNEASYLLGAVLGILIYGVSVFEAQHEDDSLKVKNFYWGRLAGMLLAALSIFALVLHTFAAAILAEDVGALLKLVELAFVTPANEQQLAGFAWHLFVVMTGVMAAVWFIKVLNVHIHDVPLGVITKTALEIQAWIANRLLKEARAKQESGEITSSRIFIDDLYDKSVCLLRTPDDATKVAANALGNFFGEHGIGSVLMLSNSFVPKREDFIKRVITEAKNGNLEIYQNDRANEKSFEPRVLKLWKWPKDQFYVAVSHNSAV